MNPGAKRYDAEPERIQQSRVLLDAAYPDRILPNNANLAEHRRGHQRRDDPPGGGHIREPDLVAPDYSTAPSRPG